MIVIVDTNILIDYSKGRGELGEGELAICPIITAEFLNNKYLKSKPDLQNAHEFIKSFRSYNIDSKVGELAGKFMREGKTEYLGDALIAGLCVKNGFLLMTRNKRHFVEIKEIKFYKM